MKRRILQDIEPIKTARGGKAKSGILAVLLVGLLIIGIFNLISVYSKSKEIKENISSSSNYGELMEELKSLASLSQNSIELKGDLFQGSRELIDASQNLTKIYDSLKKLAISSVEDIASIIENHKTVISETANHLMEAQEKIQRAESGSLPSNLKDKISAIKFQLEKVSNFIEKADQNLPALETLFGINYPHRYLILLQNNQEARPTGGFIGSVMLVDVNDGEISKPNVIDVYELDGQLQQHIEPPAEIKELTSEWRLRDSNYWPDFSISGAKAAWFFQKEGGPSVDSVIAINQNILTDLLKITGPIAVPGLDSKISSENYDVLLSYMIESKLSGPQNPKEVLKQLIPLVQIELLKPENFIQLMNLVQKEIARKNILAYSKEQPVQAFFNDIKISGTMLTPSENEDYLSVVTTSVSGNKSDKYIEQKIGHSTWIAKDGTLINQVAVNRKHTWDQKELWTWWNILGEFGFEDISDTVKSILGRGSNISLIRVYIPTGAELLETTSIQDVSKLYDADLDREYFTFRMHVNHGQEKTAVIDYKLPFRLQPDPLGTYKLHVQKQPGNNNTHLTKLISAETFKNHTNYPRSSTPEQDKVVYQVRLDYDEYFSSVWGR